LRNPQNAELWLVAARVELRAGNAKAASNLLAKALQVWLGGEEVACIGVGCIVPSSSL
jgi:cytochrome c-type biogenesis protein CcmH/NrfG